MIRLRDREYKHIVQRILGIMREYRCLRKNAVQCESIDNIAEENTFNVYRTDTHTVLAKGIKGYEQAKDRANRFRKAMNLRWDQIQFKAERQTQLHNGLESVQTAGHTPMPVETQVELITLETTIHQRDEGFEVLMIRMGIMRILIKKLI